MMMEVGYCMAGFFIDIWPWLASGLFLGCVLAYCVSHTWTQYLKMQDYYATARENDRTIIYGAMAVAIVSSIVAGMGCAVRLVVPLYDGEVPAVIDRWIPLVGYLSFFWAITSISMMFWAYTVGRKTVNKQVLKTRMTEEFDKELGL